MNLASGSSGTGTGSTAPALGVAGSPAPSRIRKLLLATDLTEASAGATDQAFELATSLKASLLAVAVIDQVRDRLEHDAQGLVERGRELGVEVSFLVWTGDPGDQIVAAAEAEAVDLVLVGSHGRGAVGRLFLGSVSEHVVRHAPCPVLVVRPREVAAH
jgi:nucleotide-binding universal stress UspA family protein